MRPASCEYCSRTGADVLNSDSQPMFSWQDGKRQKPIEIFNKKFFFKFFELSLVLVCFLHFLFSEIPTYLKLKGVTQAKGKVPGHSDPVSIRTSKHHRRRCWRTETVVVVPLHALITQHQPNTHLIQRIVERWLLIKILYGQNSSLLSCSVVIYCILMSAAVWIPLIINGYI